MPQKRVKAVLAGFGRRVVPATLALLTGLQAAAAGPLSLERFFQGHLTARGTVSNLRDGTKRDFTIDMRANWVGPQGTLIEEVAYADGERQHKAWTFDKVEPGRFVGHREDLTSDGEVTEDAEGVRMVYKAKTRVPSGDTYKLSFDDRLKLVSPTTVTVKSDITYFFLSAAEITMTITRLGAK